MAQRRSCNRLRWYLYMSVAYEREKTATAAQAKKFLAMLSPGDNSQAAQFARGMLGQEAIIESLKELVRESMERCETCERESRKLAKTVAVELLQLRKEITKLKEEQKKTSDRSKRIDKAYKG